MMSPEHYNDDIKRHIADGGGLAVDKRTGRICDCKSILCVDCALYTAGQSCIETDAVIYNEVLGNG